MPWVEFEPTIPVFEQANTVHALDRAATEIGYVVDVRVKLPMNHTSSFLTPITQ
jgi:hypothetical protein